MLTYPNKDGVFYTTVKKEVAQYFIENNLKETGDYRIFIKAIIFLSLTVFVYWFIFNAPELRWYIIILIFICCSLIGLLFSLIGFNVMHDASHGSFSSRKWINDLMVLTCDIMGASSFLWKIKHGIIHHTYTNTHDDDDLQAYPILRLLWSQKWLPHHKYQHKYAIFGYALLFMAWVLFNDFVKYCKRKIHTRKITKVKLWDHVTFWFSKTMHFIFMFYLPIQYFGWWALFGYLIMAITCGITMSVVFQLAHVVETSKFPVANEANEITEAPWAVLQVQETADFSTKNGVLSWFLGGLNLQIVHHLFPRICHVHYRAIQPIIKRNCERFGIIYNESSFREALRSHIRTLKELGRGQQKAA